MKQFTDQDKELWTLIIDFGCRWEEIQLRAKGYPNIETIKNKFEQMFHACFIEVNKVLGVPSNEEIINKINFEAMQYMVLTVQNSLKCKTKQFYTTLLDLLQMQLYKDESRKEQVNQAMIAQGYSHKYENILEAIKREVNIDLRVIVQQKQQQIEYNKQEEYNEFADVFIPLNYYQKESGETVTQEQLLTIIKSIVENRKIPYWQGLVIEQNLMKNVFS